MTMLVRKTAMVLVGVMLGAASGLVCAGTVTFNVPIDVKSYPVPNATIGVWCELRSQQGQGLASNEVHVKLNGNAYSGMKQVPVGYTPADAVSIRGYRCALVDDAKSKTSGLGAPKAIPPGAAILSQITGPIK
jgi:hypothetical protein